MRKSYKNPKELATHLKDLVDLYFEGLMTYEKLSDKIMGVVEANDGIKDGKIASKLEVIIGEEALEVIKKIIEENKNS
ncbi:conserved hypothetical protein [Clostridium collagenovorans DSM 3089]|uniref:Uncharacterized protein n=1 Tax=Clostridium collagenovorans DSM 3089 TaxID=1121306 RepID=A0A1M5VE55_9CLOT|nr:TIGR04540 family protein [Clostridium collagenovorans]SHH73404.1 conserved hypothetical protein [Clostridium collagenovorans DSM 3089]